MFPHKYEVTNLRPHTKAKRAIRALAFFCLIISTLVIVFDSVSLGFGISNDTTISAPDECDLGYCYTGAGLWSGVWGITTAIFGIIALRSCTASKSRHGVYFVLCLIASLCDIVAFILGWECAKSLFDCLRYHQETARIDRALKIMATMYSCLLLEVFVHMVASNASIGFALYNWCLPDPYQCQLCESIIRNTHSARTSPVLTDAYDIPERVSNRNKTQTLNANNFASTNYCTQSLPRYFVVSKPTSV